MRSSRKKMTTDYSDTTNSMSFSPPANSDGNDFSVSDIDRLEASVGMNMDYNNSYRLNTSSNNKPVISVARRNERERKRVRLVNQGFAILRDRVPRDRCSRGRRSSKVETLRAAIMYIRQLQQLLLESQMRYQEQDMNQCYSYVSEDTFLNSSITSGCGNYPPNNGYTHSMIHAQSYPHHRSDIGVQHANEVCDRHLVVPWFT